MNRREFLKFSSAGAVALLFKANHISLKALIHPALAAYQDMVFRGASGGEILVSRDQGKTWQLHTRLGKDYSVTDFSKDTSGRLHARIEFAGQGFDLTLARGNKYWLTV